MKTVKWFMSRRKPMPKRAKQTGGIGFITAALLLPPTAILIFGMIDFARIGITRHQMQSAASTIANRIADNPSINLVNLNNAIAGVLASLNAEPGTVSAGIQTYPAVPLANWQDTVQANTRNFNLNQENYWVGVVVRMRPRVASMLTPFLKNFVANQDLTASSFIVVRNLVNCGPNRVVVGRGDGTYTCGPNCAAGQGLILNAANNYECRNIPTCAANQLLVGGNANGPFQCAPSCGANQFLAFNQGNATYQCEGIPQCANGQVLWWDGSNYVCRGLKVQLVNPETVHRDGDQACSHLFACPAGKVVVETEQWTNETIGDRRGCRMTCATPQIVFQ